MTIVFILSYAAVFMFGGIAARLGYFDTLFDKMSKKDPEEPADLTDMTLYRNENHARVLDMP